MSMHPIPSFPLLASDQADVIRIYLELMSARESAAHAAGIPTDQPVAPCNDDSWLTGGANDLA